MNPDSTSTAAPQIIAKKNQYWKLTFCDMLSVVANYTQLGVIHYPITDRDEFCVEPLAHFQSSADLNRCMHRRYPEKTLDFCG